jgi:hypothetical protein
MPFVSLTNTGALSSCALLRDCPRLQFGGGSIVCPSEITKPLRCSLGPNPRETRESARFYSWQEGRVVHRFQSLKPKSAI